MKNKFYLVISLLIFSKLASASLLPSLNSTEAIYGSDDRTFVDQHSSPKVNELSKSIGIVVTKDLIQKKIFNSIIKADLLTDVDGLNLCADEKFANHHSVNSCTGFLIGDDLVASAGHCFKDAGDCLNKVIAFDVRAGNEVSAGYSLSKQNFYACKEIVGQASDGDTGIDYAVIRLTKKVSGRLPLKLRKSGVLSNIRDQVFMIGHPLGLPLVATKPALINDNSDSHFFKATLDSFEGNSGSPVFNAKTFEVEGILVRGEEDFLQDQSLKCYRNQTYDQGSVQSPTLRGEGVTRISEIQSLLSK